MPHYLKPYYQTEGPFGIPMNDQQAMALDAVVKKLPKEPIYEPRTAVSIKSSPLVQPNERTDISWISEESIDRQGDVVIAAGMDDSHFQLNPLVTMNHAYWLPPVGKSLWRQRCTEGSLRGVKAKTEYQSRPDDWPEKTDWPPDVAFRLVDAGLLRGKSIGFLPIEARRPTAADIDANPLLTNARYLIEKWILLEYACVYLPAQQHAVVEQVSKKLSIPDDYQRALGLWETSHLQKVSFTPLCEVERALKRRIDAIDFSALVDRTLHDGLERIKGRV